MHPAASLRKLLIQLCVVLLPAGFAPATPAAELPVFPAAIVCPAQGSPREAFAAREIRRYVYLRTGKLLPMTATWPTPGSENLIVIGQKDRPAVQRCLSDLALRAAVADLQAQQYRLKTVARENRRVWLIAGGDDLGTLYGAYRFAEGLGLRFYLEGDTVPDARLTTGLPDLDETGRPLFPLRGILPFHDFPEGPDLWNLDDYRAVLSQLTKLRMNFIGLHTYSECGWGTEPTVWLGLPEDVEPQGEVRFSYPAHYFNTARTASGHAAKTTGQFNFGAAQLFPEDDFGPDVMAGLMPWGKTQTQQNELFRRTGALLRGAFEYAHLFGIKTCVGTEVPQAKLAPQELRARLKAQGKDLSNPRDLEELYRGIFLRAERTYPLDYYWLWTTEGWRGSVSEAIVQATERDLLAAVAAARELKPPFTLATAGWALGPDKDRTYYDPILPKEMPFSCINLELGTVPVDPAFARIHGRPKWAIPWLENDLSMSNPQMWVGRMRKDAADARRYGCTGLMGIHWRTREVGPELSALAQAAWDQSGWSTLGEAAKAEKTIEVIGGGVASFSSPIAGTEDSPLYQSVRYDVSAYRLKLPNARYSVRLQFCEPFYNEKGRRIFGVTLQGRTVLEHLDIFAEVGKNHALDYTFNDIPVVDGQLEIGFLKDRSSQLMKEAENVGPKGLKEFPCIAAFVVQGPGLVRKVNCGGGPYGDYLADPVPDDQQRYAPTGDFFRDWAAHQFGPTAAEPVAAVLERIDGHLPTPAPMCPGGIETDRRPWPEAVKAYAFVDDLAACRPLVAGPGNLSRFDYWLDTFRYLKATGRVACRLGELDRAMEGLKQETRPEAKAKLARDLALPVRLALVRDWGEMVTLLLGTVGNWGEIGTVLTHEMFNLQYLQLLNRHDPALTAALGQPLPPQAAPWKDYRGPDRLIVPTVRATLMAGEALKLKIMVLANSATDPGRLVRGSGLFWRGLGRGKFRRVPFQHLGRSVYSAVLPAQASQSQDFEYYLLAQLANGRTLYYPPTAPALNQTVVFTFESGKGQEAP